MDGGLTAGLSTAAGAASTADGAARARLRGPVASMHLRRVLGAGVPGAIASMALDRWHLRHTAGLRFWKLLGTGSGQTFTPNDADPTTWGLFAVWDSVDALDQFMTTSAVAHRWSSAAETWLATLLPLTWKGT